MAGPAVIFDGVWKKFRRGERHDSLRDLVPALARQAFGRTREAELGNEEFWALKDVSFEVQPGEALGIIGPNGAGKSTALKLLTKILKPTKGHCEVQGRVGALIEVAAGFHPDLTGRENVYLQGAVMGMKRAEIARHFDEIVEFAGVDEFIDTPVKRYSSGMNARLGFAIAAHLDPQVLLIDEVLAVGDFTYQQKCHQRLKDFRRSGVSVAFVSHNLQAIASLCDSVLLLRPTLPPLLGTPSEVTAVYATAGATTSTDSRITIKNAVLYDDADRHHDERLERPVPPGTNLRLDFEIETTVDLPRCGVALQVVRSDGLGIFVGASDIDGLSTIDLTSGARLLGSVGFTANVLRGIYTVSLYLQDSQRIWPPIPLPGLATFAIHETTRASGCAELLPSYTLTAKASANLDQHDTSLKSVEAGRIA